MQLKIEYQPWYHRPWLIKRIHGTYEQHAHCFTKKDAEKIRNLIDVNKYPYSAEYKKAMKRLLIGWWLELIMWIFLTLPWLVIKIFKPNKYKSKIVKQAICQSCGYSWKV